jgi:hypothetical protein
LETKQNQGGQDEKAAKAIMADKERSLAKVWIIRNQFGRRNITLASRCDLAEKLAEALKPKAKENQLSGLKKGKSRSAKIGETEPLDTREQAAKEAGVSHGSLSAFRFLKANAEPSGDAGICYEPAVCCS